MRLLRPLLIFISLITALPVHAYDSKARALIVVDYDTGTILLEKNADQALPPASMSKLMTIYMVFEALKEGRLGLTTKFPVSTKAWQMGGSKMFLKEGDSVSVEDLIRGVVVQSGNDACIVLAEGMAGTEAEFANRMTKRARQLGMTNSVFANSTGWPHPDHKMSARDLVFIAGKLISDFPEYYPYFKEPIFEWENIVQDNRNPLLNLDIGADGLKTGHTEEAGYGLVGSVEQDDRRVVFMLTGLASAKDRAIESERLASWAMREFSRETLMEKGTVVTQAEVWLGDVATVDLVAKDDLSILVPYADRDDIDARVVYQGPLQAPIEEGAKVAEMIISIPGLSDRVFDLHAGSAVASGGFLSRVTASAQILAKKSSTRPDRMPSKGQAALISIEGIDGAGKSTQARALADHLRGLGHDPVLTREPGGAPGAEDIRRLLVEGDPDRWSAETEILLFTAARRDHLENLIRPALADNKIVITDRFADSTRVYQGAVRSRFRKMVDQLHDLAIGVDPNLTLVIDMDPEIALARGLSRGSGEDRFEDMGLAFQKALRDGFLHLVEEFPDRCRMIDGNRDADAIASDIAATVDDWLNGRA